MKKAGKSCKHLERALKKLCSLSRLVKEHPLEITQTHKRTVPNVEVHKIR